MPYIDRDTQQRIVAAYEAPQWKEQEWIPDDSPEWTRFSSERWEEKIRRLRRELSAVDEILSQALIDLLRMIKHSYGIDDRDLPQPLVQQIAFKERLKQRLETESNPLRVAALAD